MSDLLTVVEAALAAARSGGAAAADAILIEHDGVETRVRGDEIDFVSQSRERTLGIRAFAKGQKGLRSAITSTSDLARDMVERMAREAVALAQATAEDPAAGLPDEGLESAPPDLGLLEASDREAGVESRIDAARRAERAARTSDPRITNSEGSEASSGFKRVAYGSTAGFMGEYESASHQLTAMPIASENGAMQVDYWWTVGRTLAALASPEEVGRKAAARALARLGARRVPTCEVPVIFDPLTAASLLRHVVACVSGYAVYRETSFLGDRLGQRVASELVTLIDDGRVRGGLGSRPFDGEGLPTRRNDDPAGGPPRGLAPRHLLRQEARPSQHRQRSAQRRQRAGRLQQQSLARAGPHGSRRDRGHDGARLPRDLALRPWLQPRHRRLLAGRSRALDRERTAGPRRRRGHHRRQPGSDAGERRRGRERPSLARKRGGADASDRADDGGGGLVVGGAPSTRSGGAPTMIGLTQPAVSVWSERVTVALGMNPGIFTGPGTNTYLIGTGRQRILLDTGQGRPEYVPVLERALEAAGAEGLQEIVLTHDHPDHVGGLRDVLSRFGQLRVSMRPHPGQQAPPGTTAIDDGQRIETEGATLRAIFAPGHAPDHLCFALEEEPALFSGDNVLGVGTTVIPLEGGDLRKYLTSLERLLQEPPGRIYPAHGPCIDDGPKKLREYIAHRDQREAQILAALTSEPSAVMDIVGRVYTDIPAVLHPAAAHSVAAHLLKLEGEGRVRRTGAGSPLDARWRAA